MADEATIPLNPDLFNAFTGQKKSLS